MKQTMMAGRLRVLRVAVALLAAGCASQRTGIQRLEDIEYRPLAGLIPPPGAWYAPKHTDVIGRGGRPVDRPLPESAWPNLLDRRHWGQLVHRVRPQDTLYGLALQYYGQARQVDHIRQQNADRPEVCRQLRPGDWLVLPWDGQSAGAGAGRRPLSRPDGYVVAPADTLARIAETFLGDAAAYDRLARWNRLADPHRIWPGTVLRLAPPD
ncbi:MAG: LysM peptidoglycan-binding domain-containing protein [Sedimentisphaerales bacterium]|nr:LysM peptidoglycan-binding domain-containing protein [Sedimentisphaerales bacterium]